VEVLAPVRRLAEAISGTAALREEFRTELQQNADNEAFLKESLSEMERALLDPGWMRLVALSEQEFTPAGMMQMRAVCRLYSIKNPLIKRGLNLRSAYVWGQGVEITARANGRKDGEQDVQAVVADFLSDPGNLRAVTGPSARDQLEHALGTDGNVYVACVTRPLAGQVSTRVILADQIVDIISNPEDDSEPWFYHRRWTQTTTDLATGLPSMATVERYYPALGYRPAAKVRQIGSWKVAWDSPVIHLAVNRPLGWKFGVPDAYAAVDWAKAYKEFLEDWARLMRSLSRYAWKATAPGQKAGAVAARLAQRPSRSITGEPNAAGADVVLPPDVALEAISKSGATIDADSGRPIATMVASALDVPVTMLLSDPGQTGARAVAETLDTPTENAMSQRRQLWTSDFLIPLLDYVITESARAPKGSLKGTIRRDPLSGREYLTLAGDTVATVDITWPPLADLSVDLFADAIQKASSTGVIPPEVMLRLILTAFGVRDVDEIVEQMIDDDGEFVWPKHAPLAAGTQLALMSHLGGDPARAGSGPMGADGPPLADLQPDDPDDNDTGDQPGDGAPVTGGS
jgi:hypothetical protein